MERQDVKSSHLKAVGYDPSDGTLEVEFRGGQVYTYRNVPVATYQSLVGAASIGKHFTQFIKPYFLPDPRGD